MFSALMTEIYELFKDQIEKGVGDVDLKMEISAVSHDYFWNFTGYTLNDVLFSMLLGFSLYKDDYMQKRQEELFSEMHYDAKLISDLSSAFHILYEDAATWGNRGIVTKPIHVGHRFVEPFMMGVQDFGQGFDYERQERERFTSRVMDAGGMGLAIIRGTEGFALRHYDEGRIAVVDYLSRRK